MTSFLMMLNFIFNIFPLKLQTSFWEVLNSNQFTNLFELLIFVNALVNMFVPYSLPGMCSMLICFFSAHSRMKLYHLWICLLRQWNTGFLVSAMVDLLSTYNSVFTHFFLVIYSSILKAISSVSQLPLQPWSQLHKMTKPLFLASVNTKLLALYHSKTDAMSCSFNHLDPCCDWCLCTQWVMKILHA